MFEGGGELVDHGGVGGGVGVAGEEQAEVEDEFIAWVRGRGKADWAAKNAISGMEKGDWQRAESLSRNDTCSDGGEMNQRPCDHIWSRDDGADGHLVNDLGTWDPKLVDECRDITNGLPSWTSNLQKNIALIMLT